MTKLTIVQGDLGKEPRYPGFSERFNQILDWAELPPLSNGRAKSLGERFGCSKSGARKWLRLDIIPRPETFRKIVAELKEDIGYAHNESKLIAWLTYGNEADNPFVDNSLVGVDHLVLSAVYIAVHNQAVALNIDLMLFPKDKLDRIYNTLIKQSIKTNPPSKPDLALIGNLLLLASDEHRDV